MSIWINVFRTGTHTDSAGKTTEFTLDTLNTIASLYNERVTTQINNEAPIVKGHPKADEPAYGWIKELKVENEKLYARIDDIDSEFEQEVKDKKYKNVSIALNADLSLKHVGFLGAVPPAVKELEDIQFNETGIITNWYFSEFSEIPFLDTPNNPLTVTLPVAKVKPAIYAHLTDDQFADPVNYRFPIYDLASTIASKNHFYSWSYEEENYKYNKEERIFIQTRILQALQKFGVDIKENHYFNENDNASVITKTKPDKYKDYSDDEFADVDNYKFPIKTKEEVLTAIRNFMKDNIWQTYTQFQQQRIAARILSQATKFDIKQTEELWSFSTKNESQNLNISNSKNANKQMEFNQMDELTKALAEMVAWLNSNVSAEVGSQFQAQFEPIIAELGKSLQSATATATEAQATATEMSQKFNAMQKELSFLQDELTTTKITAKLNQYDLTESQFATSLSMIKANLKNSEFSSTQAEDAVFSLIADKKKADPMTTAQFSQGNAVARTQKEAIKQIAETEGLTFAQATNRYFELGGK